MTTTPNAVTDAHVADLLAQLTLEEKVSLLAGEDFWSLPELPKIGLRKLNMSDGPVGVRGVVWDERQTSLLFPSPTALAAAWDPKVTQTAGYLMGTQARAKGIHVLLAPMVNMQRTPKGGRHFESYSEDPKLTADLGAGFVQGVQSAGVSATIKHFVGNESEDERFTYDTVVDERALREVYLLPFEEAVKTGKVWAMMTAYNTVNGVSMENNSRLQNDLVRDEWGWDGVFISDWGAVRHTVEAVLGGTDIAMPADVIRGEKLVAAVTDGKLAESEIDKLATRVLRLAARVGVLGDFKPVGEHPTPADAETTLRHIAAQAMVLLANPRGVLPLDAAKLGKVALIGPNAVRTSAQGGGSAHVNAAHEISVAQGLAAALPDAELTVVEGVFTHDKLENLPLAHTVDPVTGNEGLSVEFVDADGRSLGTDARLGSTLLYWPGTFPAGTVKMTARAKVTPVADGTQLLDIIGVGNFTLTIDGGEPRNFVCELPEGADPVVALMAPPATRFEIEGKAGQPVEITLTNHLDAPENVLKVDEMASFGLGWGNPRRDGDAELAAAVEAARTADVAVVVVGTTDAIESEGFDRKDLALPGRSDELVRAVAAVNKNTVVVVNAGSPVILPWRDEVAAVLFAWLPGQEAGHSVADVLLGHTEPGGRLPTSYPAVESDVPVIIPTNIDNDYTKQSSAIGYRAWEVSGATPAYAFGHGLGYTTWSYDGVVAKGDAAGVVVEVTLTNTGARDGREVVQVYLDTPGATLQGLTEPTRLVGYAAVDVAAGATQTVEITLDTRTLSRWDVAADAWKVFPGSSTLRTGGSSASAALTAQIQL